MEIIISLPNTVSANTYKELKSYLNQLELAVHHAQKSVEHAEKDGIEITDNAYVCFEHPSIKDVTASDIEAKDTSLSEIFYDELQNVELRINLA